MSKLKELPDLSMISHIKEIRIIVEEDTKNKKRQTNIFLEAYTQKKNRDTWPQFQNPFRLINVIFLNVRNFKYSKFSSSLHQIIGFAAIDISERNWENVNYEIEDYENGTISFFCEEIKILKHTEPLYFIS